MPFYRVKRTVLDSSSFGLAQEGDLVEVNDEGRAKSMMNDGILEREEMKKNAQYFTKVEQVAEKQVEVPVTPEDVKAPEDKPEEAKVELAVESAEKTAEGLVNPTRGRPKKAE